MDLSFILQDSKYASLLGDVSKVPKDTLGFGNIISFIKNYTIQSQKGTDALAAILATYPELVIDYQDEAKLYSRIESGEPATLDDWSRCKITLSAEEGSQLFAMFLSMASDSGYIHFTDSLGLTYVLKVFDYDWISEDEPIINHERAVSARLTASNDFIPLLWENENGSWTLHTIIFPSNYYTTAGMEIGVALLASIFNTSSTMSLQNTNESSENIYDNIVNSAEALGIEVDEDEPLFEIIGDICEHYQIDTTNLITISTSLTEIVRDVTGIGGESIGSSSTIVMHTINRARSLVGVLMDISSNGVMLGALRDICDALTAKHPLEQMQVKMNLLSNAIVNSAAKKVFSGAISAFTSSGVQGVLSYISDLFKSLQKASEKDGTLSATTNSDYIPQEFIAGVLFDVVIPSVLAVVGALIMVASKIVGFIFYCLSTIVTGIISAISKSSAEQYVTFTTMEPDDSLGINLFKAAPFIGMGTYFPLTQRIIDLINANGTAFSFPVPGGYLFVGYAESGSPFNGYMEFHPFSLCIVGRDDVEVRNSLYPQLYRMDVQKYYYPQLTDANYRTLRSFPLRDGKTYIEVQRLWNLITDLWSEIPEGTSIQDITDGYAKGCQLCTAIFYLWICSINSANSATLYSPVFPIYHENIQFGDEPIMRGLAIVRDGLHPIFKIYDDIDNSRTPGAGNHYYTDFQHDWSSIMNRFSSAQQFNGHFGAIYHVPGTQTGGLYDATFSRYVDFDDYAFRVLMGSTDLSLIREDSSIVGCPSPLPLKPNYLYTPPKYVHVLRNLIIATVGAAVATAAVIAVSTGVKRKLKAKRAYNNAIADGKRTAFQMAVNGRKEIVHPDGTTETVAFDVNSVEGKEYINTCYNDYKTTAFRMNMQSAFIGGSRYDVSTFYGDADSDSSGTVEKVSSFYRDYSSTAIEETSEVPVSDFDSLLIRLIRG